MKDDYQIAENLHRIKTNYIVHDHVIDTLYLKFGLAALKELHFELLVNKGRWNGRETVEAYLDNKIEKAEQEADLKLKQLSFDVKHKKRILKWFYPTIAVTIISTSFSIFSVYNGYAKTEKATATILELQKEVKMLKQDISQNNSIIPLSIQKSGTDPKTTKNKKRPSK